MGGEKMIKLVLVRHGQSIWNLENRFTGWTDVDLSEKGKQEAEQAGKLLKANHFFFDVAYTSLLKRANETLYAILKELDEKPEVFYTWRLNERHYGALQGLNKQETANKYGEEQVHLWRRSASTRPPELSIDDPRYPGNDSKYLGVPKQFLPRTENLIDTLERVVVYYDSNIKKSLLSGKSVIVVAHGNSLRALVMHLEQLDAEDIMKVEIPTGKPLVYELDDELNVITKYYL